MRAHLALVEQLLQARSQQTPRVVMLLSAVAAVHDDAAHPAALQKCLVHREVGEVGHYLVAFLPTQRIRLVALGDIEGQRRIVWIPGERVWWQCVR